MYDSTSELLREINAGEDAYLEFKEVIFRGNTPSFGGEITKPPEEIAQVLCAFANTEGGVVVFGVNKQGKTVGIVPEKMEMFEQWVVNISQNNCVPPVYIIPDRKLLPDAAGVDHLCLKVDVPKSAYVHRSSGGRYMTRVGSHRSDMHPDHLARLMERRQITSPFEEREVRAASLQALDLEKFEAYLDRRFGNDKGNAITEVEKRLVNLKLAQRLEGGLVVPTVVGLLLFGRDPISDKLPGAFTQCVFYRGAVADANQQIDEKIFYGPVAEQIVQSVQFVDRWDSVAAHKDSRGRQDYRAFSLRAVQEAIVNAIVHRDYQQAGSNVRVFVYADRLEVSNPGGLHNTLRPENLFAGCQPYRRNQLLCGFLRDFISPTTERALMEARGEGFLMLVHETQVIGGHVEFKLQPDAVTLVIKAAPIP
jgi:predicted HTH transcriptional regulator